MFSLYLSPIGPLPGSLHALALPSSRRPPRRRMDIVKLYTLWPWISLRQICGRMRREEKKKKKKRSRWAGFEMFKVWLLHCGGWRESPSDCEEAIRKVLLFHCSPPSWHRHLHTDSAGSETSKLKVITVIFIFSVFARETSSCDIRNDSTSF